MKSYFNHQGNSAMVDVVFCIAISFIILFAIEHMMINPLSKENTKEAKEIFLISVTWPEGKPHDIDTYLMDPTRRSVFFNAKEVGMMHLERDDRGHVGDNLILPDGQKVEYESNIETVSIRGIIPGEYICNVHMYSLNYNYEDYLDENGEEMVVDQTCKVKIQLIRIDGMSVEIENEVELLRIGQEKTAFRFTLNSQGKITDKNTLEYKIATSSSNGDNTLPRRKQGTENKKMGPFNKGVEL